jgi:hypothetical protein
MRQANKSDELLAEQHKSQRIVPRTS